MDCQRSPPKTDTETRRRARSCTGSRNRSLREKPETFPWAQGGPCDHAEVAGKPRLWPGGGRKVRVRDKSSASPKCAVRGNSGWGPRPAPTVAKFLCNSSAAPRPPQDAAVSPESPGSVEPRGVVGIAPLKVESAVLLYRICFGCGLLHASGGSHGGRDVIKKTKKSKSVLQSKM